MWDHARCIYFNICMSLWNLWGHIYMYNLCWPILTYVWGHIYVSTLVILNIECTMYSYILGISIYMNECAHVVGRYGVLALLCVEVLWGSEECHSESILEFLYTINTRKSPRNENHQLQWVLHSVVNRRHNYNEGYTRCKCNNNYDEICASSWMC